MSHRVVAHKALGLADFVHDLVAGIDAGRATDAFELETVPDIDARGADVDAAVAGHAIARTRSVEASARFAALFVVADDHRAVVDKDGLEASVGADDDAELFAEPGEVEVEDARGHQHEEEGAPVLQRRGADHLPQLRDGHEVGQEDIGDGGGDQQVQGMLERALSDF